MENHETLVAVELLSFQVNSSAQVLHWFPQDHVFLNMYEFHRMRLYTVQVQVTRGFRTAAIRSIAFALPAHEKQLTSIYMMLARGELINANMKTETFFVVEALQE